jgi:hypothetical protein
MMVDVLGTEYSIEETNQVHDSYLNDMDGYCDHTTKSIVIDTFKPLPGSVKNLEEYKKQVIRHELVHAFLYESGLGDSSWGNNEEIVDWIACMFPKLMKAFEKVDAI